MTPIQNILATTEVRSDGHVPVIFNGREPRLLGYARNYSEADALAILSRVSATYLSRAINTLPSGEKREFLVLHG